MPSLVLPGSTPGQAGVSASLTSFSIPFPFLLVVFSDDHFFDALTARTCHGHPLPCNAEGTCVSAANATSVFAIGDFEYE